MIALIDGDIVAYAQGFAADTTWYMYKGRKFNKHATGKCWMKRNNIDPALLVKHHVPAPLEEVIEKVDGFVQEVLEAVQADRGIIYITGSSNFREEIDCSVPYKGNRDRSKRPTWFKEIRQHLVENWKAELVEGQEADDAMGIAQTTLREAGEASVICSIDKDLLMIPGNHYNWNSKKITFIDEYKSWFNFYKQMLTGDTVDNIVGIQGIGEVGATRILNPYSDPEGMMCAVGSAYAKHFEDPEYRMLENASLLYIRRYENETWHFDKHIGDYE